jgi:hypothetical protein
MRRNGCTQPYTPTRIIEQAVEHLYAHVAPPAEHLESIRVKLDHALAGMREQAQQEAARQQRRLATLTDERTKLLHAYYQGAIPLDLLHQEQDRIATDTASAETQLATAQRSATDVQTTLDRHSTSSPTANTPTPMRLATCAASGTKPSSYASMSTTTPSSTPTSPSPSPPSPHQPCPTNSTTMQRARTRPPSLLTAAVQIRIK